MNKFLVGVIIGIFLGLLILFLNPTGKDEIGNHWPNSYLGCLHRALDYMQSINEYNRRQVEDLDAIRHKVGA